MERNSTKIPLKENLTKNLLKKILVYKEKVYGELEKKPKLWKIKLSTLVRKIWKKKKPMN
jgi:hypothetical protein